MTGKSYCAACGKPKAFDQFTVDRPECSGLFKLCAACWGEGENNETWNEAITQRIIRRRQSKRAEFEALARRVGAPPTGLLAGSPETAARLRQGSK